MYFTRPVVFDCLRSATGSCTQILTFDYIKNMSPFRETILSLKLISEKVLAS
jgi:hypothetical protein